MISTRPFFASDRERRLWLWTLAVVAAVATSLALAWARRRGGKAHTTTEEQRP